MHFSGNQCVWHLGPPLPLSLSLRGKRQWHLAPNYLCSTRSLYRSLARPVPGHPQGCLSSYSAAAAAPLALLSLILNSFPSVPASLWLGGNEAPCQGLASSAVRPESFFACGRVIACNRCERQNLQWLPQGSRAGEIEREGERERQTLAACTN